MFSKLYLSQIESTEQTQDINRFKYLYLSIYKFLYIYVYIYILYISHPSRPPPHSCNSNFQGTKKQFKLWFSFSNCRSFGFLNLFWMKMTVVLRENHTWYLKSCISLYLLSRSQMTLMKVTVLFCYLACIKKTEKILPS